MSIDSELLGHWPLAGDAKDVSGNSNHGVSHGVDFGAIGRGETGSAAGFDGSSASVEIPESQTLAMGKSEFSLSLWLHTEDSDVIGDIAAKYDPTAMTGFNLSVMNYSGVTHSQPNRRNILFGIDNAQTGDGWTDCGRPGNAVNVYSMAVFEGSLYAGTFEWGADESGRVFRYEGGENWTECGAPDAANAVESLAVFDGSLFCGTAAYRAQGSALPESPNMTPGGHVYRYMGGESWEDCGRLGDAGEAAALVVYRGELYSLPTYSKGVFKWDGETTWEYCGRPGKCRAMTFGVHGDTLYALGNESSGVWRYEGGEDWSHVGVQDDNSQIYSLATYEGVQHVGTWPSGSVYRREGDKEWISTGRLGDEKEVMGMVVYNGKLYAGTLPLAQVYRYDGDDGWTLIGRLDWTPDVTYRRAWSMAVYDGLLFCGTLPSGHVHSFSAGVSATCDKQMPTGWSHVVAVRNHSDLQLYVDGSLAAQSSSFGSADYDLSGAGPLRLGFGSHTYFDGRMSDVRLYDRAVSDREIAALSAL